MFSPFLVLFIDARNPTFIKSEIEKHLRDYLGVKLVLWLGQGVTGDVDTDGHVDNLVAFVRPGEVNIVAGKFFVRNWWCFLARH